MVGPGFRVGFRREGGGLTERTGSFLGAEGERASMAQQLELEGGGCCKRPLPCCPPPQQGHRWSDPSIQRSSREGF